MKRFWIRCFGAVLAIVGYPFGDAKALVSTVYNGAQYKGEGNGTTVSGYIGTTSTILNKYVSTYCPSGVAVYDNIPDCTSYPSGRSLCTNTGIYCSDLRFFTEKNPSGGGMPTYWPNNNETAIFIGCYSGYYYSSTTDSNCNINATGITYAEYFNNQCCSRCPSYVGTPDSGQTSTGNSYNWDINCASGWCWGASSTTVHNLSACSIYPDPSGTTYSGANGIYTLPSGCPYVF